jgi:outer membrane scaffolding protein for murein synthesis (MipA/OmpV family)
MRFTLGAGAGAAPDYEGSDDYELTPPQRPSWNRFLAITNTC